MLVLTLSRVGNPRVVPIAPTSKNLNLIGMYENPCRLPSKVRLPAKLPPESYSYPVNVGSVNYKPMTGFGGYMNPAKLIILCLPGI